MLVYQRVFHPIGVLDPLDPSSSDTRPSEHHLLAEAFAGLQCPSEAEGWLSRMLGHMVCLLPDTTPVWVHIGTWWKYNKYSQRNMPLHIFHVQALHRSIPGVWLDHSELELLIRMYLSRLAPEENTAAQPSTRLLRLLCFHIALTFSIDVDRF